MRSSRLVLALMVGLGALRAQDVPAQTAQRNPFEAVAEHRQAVLQRGSGPSIRAVEFSGARRMPQSALRAVVSTWVGGEYDAAALQEDCQALRNTQRFSYVAWEMEPTPEVVIARFVLVERPLIASIEYKGDRSVTLEEVLERLEQRKVRMRVETLFDEEELPRATSIVRELVSEKGRPNLVVTPLVERIGPPSISKITFTVAETR